MATASDLGTWRALLDQKESQLLSITRERGIRNDPDDERHVLELLHLRCWMDHNFHSTPHMGLSLQVENLSGGFKDFKYDMDMDMSDMDVMDMDVVGTNNTQKE